MALVDLSATAADNVLQSEELEELVHEDLRYRDKQLLRLKDEVLDLEDFHESVSLNEFTLDDFRMELANYIDTNRERLQEAPFGLYTVTPPHPQYPTIQPGVIYCLRQQKEVKENESVNPLQPYYLIYIRDDGEVRYNFTAPKQILEIFRALCQGQEEPYQQLCDLFDNETHNGEQMEHYNELLEKAVKAIVAQFARRATANLFTGRGGKMIDNQKRVTDSADFELITWLVIKEES